MLQTRNAKRPAQAAVRFAVDAVEEGLLDKAAAIATIDAGKLDALLHPAFARDAEFDVLAEGVAASPGAAKGEIVFTAAEAVAAGRGRARRDPRAPVHRGRRRGRLPRRAGHPHRARAARRATPRWSRAGWASRACRARRRSRSTCNAKTVKVAGHAARRGRHDRDRRLGRAWSPRTTCRSRSPRCRDEFETVLGWADEVRTLRRARERRHARGRRQGARVRRRGDRPVPHRAHVHGRRPPAEDAGDDHGRDRGRPPRARWTSCCRSSRRTSRACSTR